MISVGNITIDGTVPPEGAADWSPTGYEHAVSLNLFHLFASPVGRAVRRQATRRISIVPHDPDPAVAADAGPMDAAAATNAGSAQYICSGEEMGEAASHGALGTGRGSDSVIRFTPGHLVPYTDRGLWSHRSDEVLCHELVHAIRLNRGVGSCEGIPYGYGTFDEFCAVAVTNVYSSTQRRLIHDRYFGVADTEVLLNPFGEARVHRGSGERYREVLLNPFGRRTRRERAEAIWIQRMEREQRSFVEELARISPGVAPYNPFRDRSPYLHYVSWRR